MAGSESRRGLYECLSICCVGVWRFPEGQDRVLNEALYAMETELGGNVVGTATVSCVVVLQKVLCD